MSALVLPETFHLRERERHRERERERDDISNAKSRAQLLQGAHAPKHCM